MVFHCPGDFINRNYTRPALRPVWDFVRGIAIATTIGSGGSWLVRPSQVRDMQPSSTSSPLPANAVQNALTCKWSNGLPSSVHTCIVAGTLAAGGGALIQEYLNLLLLPQDMVSSPWILMAILHTTSIAPFTTRPRLPAAQTASFWPRLSCVPRNHLQLRACARTAGPDRVYCGLTAFGGATARAASCAGHSARTAPALLADNSTTGGTMVLKYVQVLVSVCGLCSI
jgi:hypothetical protein